MSASPITVRLDAEHSRYLAERDGSAVGELHYTDMGDAVDLDHTFIDPSLRGAGVGARLVEAALDGIARNSGKPVIASCPFAAAVLRTHPEQGQQPGR